MPNTVKVLIEWSPEKLLHLPTSGSYSTVAKFSEDADYWPNQAWSVVLEFEPLEISSPVLCEGTVRFLVPTAPQERLKTGCEFDLYEGFKKTASVKVL